MKEIIVVEGTQFRRVDGKKSIELITLGNCSIKHLINGINSGRPSVRDDLTSCQLQHDPARA